MKVINQIAASPAVSVQSPSLWERIRDRFRDRNDAGQSIVEFALCAPILLLLVTGITTFGLTLNNYLVMTNAVNTSAQLLAIIRGSTQYPDPCSAAVTAFESAAPNLNISNLKFSFVLNTTTYASNTTSCTSGASNLLQGQPAKIVVTYPCNLAVYGANLLPGCNLQVQTTELVQ